MRILLTGGTGFIGAHLLHKLTPQHAVYAIARTAPVCMEPEYVWLEGDLSAPETLSLDLFPPSIDAVIYLAQSREYRNFPEKVDDMFHVNVLSVLKLLELARLRGVSKFIYASTANVYKQSHHPISEEFALAPQSFYARSKRMAEMLVESYADFFQCVVLRLFTVYGPGQDGMLMPALVDKVRRGLPIQVQGKKGFKLSPIHVDDVVSIFDRIIGLGSDTKPDFQVFNVGGEQNLNIFDIGTSIGSVLGIVPIFEFADSEEPAGWSADVTKLKKELDLPDLIDISEGILNSYVQPGE